MENYGYCNQCRKIVPIVHKVRDNKVFLEKQCQSCGPIEYLISADAALYHKKRAFMNACPSVKCQLHCLDCTKHKKPDIIFIETTNRCNMNCPICLTNVPAMKFTFEPTLDYFERIFRHFSHYNPKPYVQLFGGEPTLREDLFDIIRLGKSYGFSMRVVTNGLKLADEQYCAEIVRLGVMVNISFDGLNRQMYEKLRGTASVLDVKLAALENLAKHQKGKTVIMTVVDKEMNRNDMPEFFRFSLKNLHVVRGIYFMPLTHMWSKEKFDYEPVRTTLEDVEHMVNDAIPGGKVEFVPLGSLFFTNVYKIFGIKNMPFLGVHPNCESITYLVSNGKTFVSLSQFLKTSLFTLVGALRALEERIVKAYPSGNISGWGKAWVYGQVTRIFLAHFNFGAIVGEKGVKALLVWLKIIGALLIGKKAKDIMRAHTQLKGILQIIILPFEDYKTAESERMSMCSSCFVYVNPETDQIQSIPVCTWDTYKDNIMQKVAARFNKASVQDPTDKKR